MHRTAYRLIADNLPALAHSDEGKRREHVGDGYGALLRPSGLHFVLVRVEGCGVPLLGVDVRLVRRQLRRDGLRDGDL